MQVSNGILRIGLALCFVCSASMAYSSGKIVLVMDDLGNQHASGIEALNVPWVTTVAIMPGRPFTHEMAQYAHSLGKEIIIHAPMSNTADFPLGPMGLTRLEGKRGIIENVRLAIADVPHAVGFSNHMGSQLTQDSEAMEWIVKELKRQNFYFFDSRTVSTTVAWSVAERFQVPWSMRDIFLDHFKTETFIDGQWKKAVALARQGMTITVICHPYPETLAYLNNLTLTDDELSMLVPLSTVLNYTFTVQRSDRNIPQGV